MSNLNGQSIGRYHILEQLGEGGMATVYKAYDTRLERNVAVKVLRTDQFIPAQLQMVLQRFEREAKSLAKLSNPNIVNILDFGEHEGMPYLVMEYLPGGTLKKKMGSAVPWREALRILLPVAHGLAYAHSHGVIHRDVKPANILLNEDDRPVLTDFGIAKLLEAPGGHTLTGSGVGIGTPEYMAPEQGIGASTIDERADVYSLGIVMYEMVTGRKPYIADTPMAVVLKQMTDPLPRPTEFIPDLPEGVEQILIKALAKEPQNRYENMITMIEAMDELLEKTIRIETPTIIPQEVVKEKRKGNSSQRVLFSILGILALALIFFFGMPWIGRMLPTSTTQQPTYTPVVFPTSTGITLPSSTPAGFGTPITTEAVDQLSQTVLAYFASQPPTFEDDFSTPKSSEVWGRTSEGVDISSLVKGGVLTVTDHIAKNKNGSADYSVTGTNFPTNGLFDAQGVALQFDINFETKQPVTTVGVQFRGHEFNLGADGSWELLDANKKDNALIADGVAELQPGSNTVLVVAYGNNMGIYINNVLLHSMSGFTIRNGAIKILVRGDNDCNVEFDNIKFWDLDG
jgi:serine/threonine protein kinase